MAALSNFKNGLIAFLATFPCILFYLCFLHNIHNEDHNSLWNWCNNHPILLANIMFFLNVNVLFWFIALLQSNLHWVTIILFYLLLWWIYFKKNILTKLSNWKLYKTYCCKKSKFFSKSIYWSWNLFFYFIGTNKKLFLNFTWNAMNLYYYSLSGQTFKIWSIFFFLVRSALWIIIFAYIRANTLCFIKVL